MLSKLRTLISLSVLISVLSRSGYLVVANIAHRHDDKVHHGNGTGDCVGVKCHNPPNAHKHCTSRMLKTSACCPLWTCIMDDNSRLQVMGEFRPPEPVNGSEVVPIAEPVPITPIQQPVQQYQLVPVVQQVQPASEHQIQPVVPAQQIQQGPVQYQLVPVQSVQPVAVQQIPAQQGPVQAQPVVVQQYQQVVPVGPVQQVQPVAVHEIQPAYLPPGPVTQIQPGPIPQGPVINHESPVNAAHNLTTAHSRSFVYAFNS